jgi:hypothetical protein
MWRRNFVLAAATPLPHNAIVVEFTRTHSELRRTRCRNRGNAGRSVRKTKFICAHHIRLRPDARPRKKLVRGGCHVSLAPAKREAKVTVFVNLPVSRAAGPRRAIVIRRVEAQRRRRRAAYCGAGATLVACVAGPDQVTRMRKPGRFASRLARGVNAQLLRPLYLV